MLLIPAHVQRPPPPVSPEAGLAANSTRGPPLNMLKPAGVSKPPSSCQNLYHRLVGSRGAGIQPSVSASYCHHPGSHLPSLFFYPVRKMAVELGMWEVLCKPMPRVAPLDCASTLLCRTPESTTYQDILIEDALYTLRARQCLVTLRI